ncbi:MAG: hypothetical protein LUQ37_07530 [Methanoregulaceae archaeon]|jgi:hypothetical protein|nr:hypothetical protein [Methanoregulaceae archaeon]
MGLKDNFSSEEWENLIGLPSAVSMTMIVAAPNVMGVWGETKAMMQEPAKLAASSGSSLVGLLLAEMQPRLQELAKKQQAALKHDKAGYRAHTMEACRLAATALTKVPPEEALAYKNWVLGIGLKVAEAAKEHGIAVSDPEKAVIAEISSALGVTGP